MNDSKYKYILYLIAIVILCTIGIQVYWNYKNYTNNKQQLINDVQTSLDNAVNRYYEGLAKETTFGFAFEANSNGKFISKKGRLDSLIKNLDSTTGQHILNFKELDTSGFTNINILKSISGDSIMNEFTFNDKHLHADTLIKKGWSTELRSNQALSNDIKILTSKVIVSLANDTLNLKQIDSLVKLELGRKSISVDFYLDYKSPSDYLINQVSGNNNGTELGNNHRTNDYLSTNSQSTLLPPESLLTILFTNTTKVILNRMLGGIFISTLLVLAVISSLFYLLKIIKHQKQLAEVKNDLISNITHEFKTPIATIGVALESIQNFNAIEDKEKTKNYLDMSSNQLSKLNTMVEKLLETATLDSENLELNTDSYNISEVVSSIVEKHKLQHSDKSTTYTIQDDVLANVDVFHFENAINNIIDNAFKYGGDTINVNLKRNSLDIAISISDNGYTLSKANKERIFEKFYRVPKGNMHDIKGFGIGLYYAKKIIEKHNGSISLDLKNKQTTFNISLPNV
nr:ATP-binding protein [uncultured Psychroserpens sp.]